MFLQYSRASVMQFLKLSIFFLTLLTLKSTEVTSSRLCFGNAWRETRAVVAGAIYRAKFALQRQKDLNIHYKDIGNICEVNKGFLFVAFNFIIFLQEFRFFFTQNY